MWDFGRLSHSLYICDVSNFYKKYYLKIRKENKTKEIGVRVKERFEDANIVGLQIDKGP